MVQLAIILSVLFSLIALTLPTGPGHYQAAAEDAWLSGWNNRIQLSIDHRKIEEPLFDFPLLVHLSSSAGIGRDDVTFIFDQLGSSANRKKIAITTTDGTTQCYAEIEKWDHEKKEAWIWVRVPFLANNADMKLYLYYDKNVEDNTIYIGDKGSDTAQKVWDNHFVMVQHLDENGSGAPGEFKDSTGRHNDGTGGDGNQDHTPTRVDSPIGSGQRFDGINDYILMSDRDDFSINTTGSLTVSLWASPAALNFNDSGDYIRWMGKGWPDQSEWHFRMYNTNTTVKGAGGTRSQWISFYVHSPEGGLGAGGGGPHSFLNPGDWIFLTARTDMVKSYLWFNDTPGRADSWANFNIKCANGTEPLLIGTLYRELDEWWNGRIDEVRISNVFRSDAWVKADYHSQSDRLIDFGKASIQEVARPDLFRFYLIIGLVIVFIAIIAVVLLMLRRTQRRH